MPKQGSSRAPRHNVKPPKAESSNTPCHEVRTPKGEQLLYTLPLIPTLRHKLQQGFRCRSPRGHMANATARIVDRNNVTCHRLSDCVMVSMHATLSTKPICPAMHALDGATSTEYIHLPLAIVSMLLLKRRGMCVALRATAACIQLACNTRIVPAWPRAIHHALVSTMSQWHRALDCKTTRQRRSAYLQMHRGRSLAEL